MAAVELLARAVRALQAGVILGETCEVCHQYPVAVLVSRNGWFVCRACLNQAFDLAEKAASCPTTK